MSDNNMIPSVSDVTDAVKVAKEILPGTVSETDGAISTIVGWFNNVVLYPVKKANITYRYKLECFEKDLRNEVDKIPKDKVCEPKLMIAGPTLEALKYTYDEEALRNMYVKLLATSMDSSKDKFAHPSFVDIIKRMDSIDAQLFRYLSTISGYIRATNPKIGIVGTNQVYTQATPEWFIGWQVPGCDIFDTSASLIRLSNFGLIELMYDRTTEGQVGYENLEQNQLLQALLIQYRNIKPEIEKEIRNTRSVLYVNEYGQQFAKCCL